MDLIVKDSGGHNVVAREQAMPEYLPAATVDAARVRLFIRNADEPEQDEREIAGHFGRGSQVSIPFNPVRDRNLVIRAVPYSAFGTPGQSVSATLLHQRETEVPVIGQATDATTEDVQVGVSNYSPFARQRRVKIATALDGSGHLVDPTETIIDYGAQTPPDFITVTRGTGPQTVYVAVAHRGGPDSPWTPDSNIIPLTFASSEGTGGGGGSGSGEPTGGTTGDYDPTRRDQIDLSL